MRVEPTAWRERRHICAAPDGSSEAKLFSALVLHIQISQGQESKDPYAVI
jgi:hypothetical protein